MINRKLKYISIICGLLFLFARCVPDLPVTSVIAVDMEVLPVSVNPDLYGLNIEEVNYAIEGGLYAELIRNRSFEDGALPLHSAYDRARGVLVTPNKWTLSFPSSDSVVGWHALSPKTYFTPDITFPVSNKNYRSLAVSVFIEMNGRGGVVAEGYNGISLKKGERYDFSFYIRSTSPNPRTVYVSLEDSSCSRLVSERFEVTPSYDWRQFRHVFTAIESLDNAVLTIAVEETAFFHIDAVSLFPQNTWLKRQNGLREDLVNELAALNPKFIRFPGGLFVEGYMNGTYPVWKESIGPVAERRHFWNIWGYGSSNGMGYHEFLQLCKDLKADPVYVINSGVTNQERRPRYEVITEMDKLIQDALDAIAYANAPADSLWGEMRMRNGHPEPFNLRYIEIGSENYGSEYKKRFHLFKEAINKVYPEITVISSSTVSDKLRGEWVDTHFYSNPNFFIANSARYKQEKPSLNRSSVFIGEFGVTSKKYEGTMMAAIGEACFLIGAEEHPQIVKRIAYAPVLGNMDYPISRYPLLQFKKDSLVHSPSFYLLKLFASNRGEQVFPTNVTTYSKPNVENGRASIDLFDDSYEIKNIQINGKSVENFEILKGAGFLDGDRFVPTTNRWNSILLGDSGLYNYEFSATIKRIKGSDPIQLRIRDNGLEGDQSNHIGITMGEEYLHFYNQAGSIKDTLAAPVRFPFVSHRDYRVSIKAANDLIECYIDGVLMHRIHLKPFPSLVAVATLDEKNNQLILKVVNTTNHDERTELSIRGVNVRNEIEILELSGMPESKNTFQSPDKVIPVTKTYSFKIGMPMVYQFPPHSVSVIKMQLD